MVVNLTVIGPNGTGFATSHPCLEPVPNTSSVNYTENTNVANEIVARLGADGALCIDTSEAAHVALDSALSGERGWPAQRR